MKRLLLLACAASAAVSCRFPAGVDDAGPPVLDIQPLSVGNAWVYLDSTFQGHGPDSVTVDSSRSEIFATRVVDAGDGPDTVYEGRQSRGAGAPFSLVTYYKTVGHASYVFGAREDTAEVIAKIPHVLYPAPAGTRYSTRFPSFAAEDGVRKAVFDTVRIEILDTRHTCVTPAGTFACVQYRGTKPGWTARTYYAPGIGYLGSEIVRVEGNGDTVRTRKVLKSYALR